MPLAKATLADALTRIFQENPANRPEAAYQWADAYLNYSRGALATAGGLPVNADAGLGILVGTLTSALGALQSQASAALIAQGVTSFWQMILWVGPAAAGTTVVGGNFMLAAALGSIFADLSKQSASDKASRIADAFDSNARLVIVSEIPFVQPAPPIVGPIQ